MSVCYWPVVEPQLYSPDKFPCFIFCAPCGRKDTHVYGFPVFEYPDLIKVKLMFTEALKISYVNSYLTDTK